MHPPQRVQFSFGGPTTPSVKILLIVTVAGFFLQALTQRLLGYALEPLLGLVPYFVTHRLFLWQPVTYLFLHGGFFHLAFNLLVLWMFGCELERAWGNRFFLKYFFVCGIGAGIFVALLTPANASLVPTIGASGALYGVLLAYGLLFPDRKILLWFVLPIRAKHFVLFIGAVAFYSTLTLPGSGISHLAHLSGLVIGYIYLRGWGHFRLLHRRYLEWKLKRMKKKFRVIDGGNDQDKPPYIH
jgi:membrane associated rhomboid family serine protease